MYEEHTLFALLVGVFSVFAYTGPNSFHIRQRDGKCFEYEQRLRVIVLKSVCREKFRWDGGVRLIHVPTKKCLLPATSTGGIELQLTGNCSATDTLFYNGPTGTIKHFVSGKCIGPEANAAKAAEKSKVVMGNNCASVNARFWLVRDAMYVIRHISGLCWVAHKGLDYKINLKKRYICDRFRYINGSSLQHVATGRCVTYSQDELGVFELRLTPTTSLCTPSSTTLFDLDENNRLHQTEAGKCVHGLGGRIDPEDKTRLVLENCDLKESIRFYFYDERSNYFYYYYHLLLFFSYYQL